MINGKWKYQTNDIYKNLIEFQQKLDNGIAAANESQTIMTLKLQEDDSG